jgi:hypothetical protein
VKRDFEAINDEMFEEKDKQERLLREAEERLEASEKEEYARRDSGRSSPVIPAAIQRPPSGGYNSGGSQDKNYVAGAVSATDSESESEFITQLRGNRPKFTFKWTQDSEDQLEEILIKH